LGATFLNERKVVTFDTGALQRVANDDSPRSHGDTEKAI